MLDILSRGLQFSCTEYINPADLDIGQLWAALGSEAASDAASKILPKEDNSIQ